jgi:hypothetical protein
MVALPKTETKLQPFLELAQQLSLAELLKLIQLLLQFVQRQAFPKLNGTTSAPSLLSEIKTTPVPGWGEGQDLWADEAEFAAFEQYVEESRGHC